MFSPLRLHRMSVLYLLFALGLIALSARPARSARPQDPERGGVQPDGQTKTSPVPSQSQPSILSKKSADPIKDGSTVKLTTDVVTLTVTVTDRKNRLVTGLDRQNFEVFEDKVKQNIEFFSDEDAPLSVGILFDLSGSMERKMKYAREALRAFIETCHHDDDFFLITFNQRAQLVAEFTDGNTILSKMATVVPSGPTALYDAAYLGLEKVQQGRHSKRAILVISDGQDNASRYNYNELRNLLKETDVQIYSIGIVSRGFGADVLEVTGQSFLEALSDMTGGKAFFPRSGPELEDATTRIALELRHQYSLGYIPNNDQRNGQWRKIKIKLHRPGNRPDLYIRAKEGYFALPK
ncbi:MAG TPA: VWA domain-containing protein [Blastocatellia bacterium]|nr:VWA domain-containing protein [Blastocatellia bacterium]